VHGNVKTK